MYLPTLTYTTLWWNRRPDWNSNSWIIWNYMLECGLRRQNPECTPFSFSSYPISRLHDEGFCKLSRCSNLLAYALFIKKPLWPCGRTHSSPLSEGHMWGTAVNKTLGFFILFFLKRIAIWTTGTLAWHMGMSLFSLLHF